MGGGDSPSHSHTTTVGQHLISVYTGRGSAMATTFRARYGGDIAHATDVLILIA